MKPQINALYLCVKNMDRAVRFYENIFRRDISSYDKRMSSFEFDNISFLLFDPSADNEEVVFGNNVIPNIEVEDIQEMMDFVKENKIKILMPLEKINEYQIFQIEDTEGNIIEFYEVQS